MGLFENVMIIRIWLILELDNLRELNVAPVLDSNGDPDLDMCKWIRSKLLFHAHTIEPRGLQIPQPRPTNSVPIGHFDKPTKLT